MSAASLPFIWRRAFNKILSTCWQASFLCGLFVAGCGSKKVRAALKHHPFREACVSVAAGPGRDAVARATETRHDTPAGKYRISSSQTMGPQYGSQV